MLDETPPSFTRAELDALAQRLEALEARLGGEGETPAEGGLVVRAPFAVVNEKGEEVFAVEAENTRVEVSVGVGEVGISMESAGQDGAKLEVSGGIDRGLELAAGPALSKLEITQGSNDGLTFGYLDQGETGIEITAGEDTVFEVKSGAEETTLALGAESGQQATLESGKEAKLSLGQGEEPAVSLTAQADGGELRIGKGEEPLVALVASGQEGKLELGGGEAAATLSGQGETGLLLLGKEAGKHARLDTEGAGGLLSLGRGAEPAVTLEAGNDGGQLLLGPGGEATLRLMGKSGGGTIEAGDPEGKRLQMGINPVGDPVVQLADEERRVVLALSAELQGALVASAEGGVTIGKSESGWGLQLSKQGAMLASLGIWQQEPPGLRLFSNDAATVALKAQDAGGELVFGAGQPKVKLTTNDTGGQMELGPPDGTRVQVGAFNDRAVVQVAQGDDRANLVVSAEQVGVGARTGEGFAEFGKGSEGFGVLLSQQGQPLAGLGTLAGRGVALRIYDEGAQVAAVGAGEDGGGTVRVFPAGGGSSSVQLDALGNGGLITVFDSGGSPAAALDGIDRLVALYNSGGTPVATFGLGSNGSGGNGIMVIAGKTASGHFRRSNDNLVNLDEIKHHISNILSGMYSLGGETDSAIIEYRVKFDPCFENVSFKGVPDVRLIVFRGIPLFAMIRLPTRHSDGRANLHQGAVGVGIDMGSGRTNYGVMHSRPIKEHPDTGFPLAGIQIPEWDRILEMAATCYELAPLGYLGVDLVLDRDRGPMMLELNARPGLAIQIANGQGLEPILKYAQTLGTIPASAKRRVQIGKEIRHKFSREPA